MKKSKQAAINQQLDRINGTKQAYKKLYKNESSPLLRRLGAEARGEVIREAKKKLKNL